MSSLVLAILIAFARMWFTPHTAHAPSNRIHTVSIPTTLPTTQPQVGEYTVTLLEGAAEFRKAGDKWQKLSGPTKLVAGDEVRVGLRGTVNIKRPDGSDVNLWRLGTHKRGENDVHEGTPHSLSRTIQRLE